MTCTPKRRKAILQIAGQVFAALALAAWGAIAADKDAAGEAETPPPPARIRKIDVRVRPIFDPADDALYEHFPYTWVDALKIPTWAYVVRDEVLLKPGDPVDDRLLQESERNIRALGFLREVHITPVPVEPGAVDLVVVVQETWTFQPQFSIAGGGGEVVGTGGLQETDFLGMGKVLQALFTHDVERDQVQLAYEDPRILRSRYATNIQFDQLSDGRFRYLSLERPFFAWDAGASYGGAAWDNSRSDHLYELGEEVREWRHLEEDVSGKIGFRLSDPGRIAHRLIFGYHYHQDRFLEAETEPASPLPEDRRRSGPYVSWEWLEDHYITRRNVRAFGVQEDFALGWKSAATLGVQPEVFGSFHDTQSFDLTWHQGFASESLVALANLGLASRIHDAQTENLVGSWAFEAYYTGLWRQTWALGWKGEAAHDRDPEDRFVVGGLNGLRGYPDRFVNGDGGTLFHLEDRIFIWDNILGLASLGAVGFYDAALPIVESEPLWIGDLKQSAGLGLRIGLPASAIGKVLRLDLGFALNSTNGESRLNLSFGTGQVFDLATRLR